MNRTTKNTVRRRALTQGTLFQGLASAATGAARRSMTRCLQSETARQDALCRAERCARKSVADGGLDQSASAHRVFGGSMTKKKLGASTAESLLIGLRVQGFSFRVDESGQLLCSPASKLTAIQRNAIAGSREGLVQLVLWETERIPTNAMLNEWFAEAERKRPLRTLNLKRTLVCKG